MSWQMRDRPHTRAFLAKVHAYMDETGIKGSYLGKKCCGNSMLIARLEAGGGLEYETAMELLEFMANEKVSRK